MADDKDVLLEMFKHYMNQGLYHQTQRAATANILLILSGVTIGFITVDKHLEGPGDVSAALFLIVLGLFGILWSRKYHERYAYYLQRARGYRNKLDEALPESISLLGINEAADAVTVGKYGWLYEMRVWWLWAALYMLIVVFGVVILGLIWPLLMLVLIGLIMVVVISRPDLADSMLSFVGRIVSSIRRAWHVKIIQLLEDSGAPSVQVSVLDITLTQQRKQIYGFTASTSEQDESESIRKYRVVGTYDKCTNDLKITSKTLQ